MKKSNLQGAAYILLAIFILTSIGHTKNVAPIERFKDRGYLTQTSKGRVFFVRNPIVIDPGVEVVDPATIKKRNLCILSKTTLPLECPPQEISFRLKARAAGSVMIDLRLEAETAWHRLNRAQKNFAP